MSSDGEVPEERCGFVLEPEDVHEDAAEELEAGSDEWYEDSRAACCWREVWDGADDGRCIWHAETDDKSTDALADARADRPERLDGAYLPAVGLRDAVDFEACRLWAAAFDGALLQGASFAEIDACFAQFNDTDLRTAQFDEAHLFAAQFQDAFLLGARFHDADLSAAQFQDARLSQAQFDGADLEAAQFHDSILEAARFHDADVTYAQFQNALLMRAQFDDADLRGANFEGAYMDLEAIDEDAADFDRATVFGWSQLERNQEWGRAARSQEWGRAARNYRAFQQTLREHAIPGEVRRYRVREMHMRRKAAYLVSPIEWAKLALARWTTLYGESPYRVVYTSLVVMAGSALLYPRWGLGIDKTSADPVTISYPFEAGDLLAGLGKSFYFSVITFTTLGYGDIQPLGFGEAVATAESFLGALLMALLVYVLGRRATW